MRQTDAPRRAVFVDRDGTLIVDRHYLADPAGVELLPGAAEAVARLNRAGLPVLLATNQSGIGRGYFDEAAFHAVQARVVELLRQAGARLDGVFFCPHAPSAGCACRKPEPGLFEQAASEHGVRLRGSFFVGDRLRDVEPALRLGGRGFLVAGEAGRAAATPSGITAVASLAEAAEHIVAALDAD